MATGPVQAGEAGTGDGGAPDRPILVDGARGDHVTAVQRTLDAGGYDPGPVDGRYGPRTAAGVRRFQRSRNLDDDGVVGPATWAALVGGGLGPARPELRRVATLPVPRRSAGTLLELAVLDGRVVAFVEIEPGAVGYVDVRSGARVGEPLVAGRGKQSAPALAVAPRRPAEGSDGGVIVVAASDRALRGWSLVSGGVVAWPEQSLPVDVDRLSVTEAGGTYHVVGEDADGRAAVVARRPAGAPSAPWSVAQVTGADDLTSPVVYADGDRAVMAAIDPHETPHRLVRAILSPEDPYARPASKAAGSDVSAPVDLGAAERLPAPSVTGADHAFARLLAGGRRAAATLVTRSPAGLLERWRGDTGEPLPGNPTVDGDDTRLLAVAARTLAATGPSGPVRLFDLAGGAPVGAPLPLSSGDPDGTSVAPIAAVSVVDSGRETVVAVVDTRGGLWSATVANRPSGWRQPNPSLARDYWTTDDTLGYGAYARAIADFIEHPDTRPPLTIGIKGPWGAGKTSVMRMVQGMLDPPVDRADPEWRFRELKLTTRGQLALTRTEATGDPDGSATSGTGASPVGDGGARVRRTTLRTVLDRASEAPLTEVDLRSPDDPQADVAADDDQVSRPTVWFNPWMYQTGEQLWAGLAHEIITQVTGRLPWVERQRFWLELNLRRVNREALRRRVYALVFQRLVVPLAVALVGLAIAGVAALAGYGLAAILAAVPTVTAAAAGAIRVGHALGRDAAQAVPQMVSGPIGLPEADELVAEVGSWTSLVAEPDYQTRAGFLYFVQTDMKQVLDLVASPQRPLVVFIDDLDRCSPGVVTQTIEAVNLFLAGQFPNCIFVLAIEPAVVAAHIETAHTALVSKLEEYDTAGAWSRLGWRFLDKIVQLPLALPPPHAGVAEDYVRSLFRAAPQDPPAVAAADEDALVAREVRALAEQDAQPSLDDIPRERDEVVKRMAASGLDADAARRVADDVAIRRFAGTYSDDDDAVRRAVVAEALALPDRNPREMKRLVNLFRFYALVVNQRGVLLEERSQEMVFAQVARLAALANRWPHLLGTLGSPSASPSPHDERRLVFDDLESAARLADDDWTAALRTYGLTGRDGTRPEPPGLRDFLRGGTTIGVVARELL